MISQKILENLICPECHFGLNYLEKKLICNQCREVYPIKNDVPYLIKEQKRRFFEESDSNVIINKVKLFFKRYPALFNFLYDLFGTPFLGRGAKEVIGNLGQDKIILNLGSGTRVVREDVINIDFYPFNNVRIVADITNLPFRDESVDAIICECVLEHIKNPQRVVKEIGRVLKPGAIVYIVVPFVVGFHASPDDYYRWSEDGLRELMKDFEEEEVGIRQGPTLALLSIFNEWLATLFSFGSKKLQQILLLILMILTLPLRLFDYLIFKFSSSKNIAYCFYYLGKKKKT